MTQPRRRCDSSARWVAGLAALLLGGCAMTPGSSPSDELPDLEDGLATMETYLSALQRGDLETAFELVCTSGPFATTWEAFEAHHRSQPAIDDYEVYEGKGSGTASVGRGTSTTTTVYADVMYDDGHRIEQVRPSSQSFGLCSMTSDDPEVSRLDPTP